MVRQHVLEAIEDPDLKLFVVWEPILKTDSAEAARLSSGFLPDDRVMQYWASTRTVGRSFQDAIRLEGEPAWDVYLVYDRGIRWADEPPAPTTFQHQLGGRLPDDLLLNGPVLADGIRALLHRSPQ